MRSKIAEHWCTDKAFEAKYLNFGSQEWRLSATRQVIPELNCPSLEEQDCRVPIAELWCTGKVPKLWKLGLLIVGHEARYLGQGT